MKGCSNAEAALIEAYEEAGIRASVIGTGKIGFYHYAKTQRSGLEAELRVTVFLATVDEEMDDWPEQAERDRAWYDVTEAAGLVAEPALAKLIRRVPRLVRRKASSRKT